MHCKIFNLQIMGDNRGKLVALEAKKNIPFDIKRVYYIYDTTPGAVRGKHSHLKSQQVVVVLRGSCKFLLDDGKEKKVIKLDDPAEGLFIGRNIWREMYDFTPDCVLMVLTNEYYDEGEYIRNYEQFKKSQS